MLYLFIIRALAVAVLIKINPFLYSTIVLFMQIFELANNISRYTYLCFMYYIAWR